MPNQKQRKKKDGVNKTKKLQAMREKASEATPRRRRDSAQKPGLNRRPREVSGFPQVPLPGGISLPQFARGVTPRDHALACPKDLQKGC